MERRQKRNREQWTKIIGEQAQSGLTAKKYCEQESIGLASFYQWRQRIRAVEVDRAEPQDLSAETFIDMGSLEELESRTRVQRPGYTVTLDVGEGLKITVRGD